MFAAFDGKVPEDAEHGDGAEGPEACVCKISMCLLVKAREASLTPLVATLDKSANETSNDHDLVKEDSVENGRPG